jgi:hypothetical protein
VPGVAVGAGVAHELRKEAFGLLDQAGDQGHRAEVVAEPDAAACGDGGQGIVDQVEGVVTARGPGLPLLVTDVCLGFAVWARRSESVPVSMMLPPKVSRSTIATQSRGSVKVLVQLPKRSLGGVVDEVIPVVRPVGLEPTTPAEEAAKSQPALTRDELLHPDRYAPGEHVAAVGISARTQNGHIRNDTRDVSRRICKNSFVPIWRKWVRRGSTVRVRQRASIIACSAGYFVVEFGDVLAAERPPGVHERPPRGD